MNFHIKIACYLNVQWEFSKSFLKQFHHIHNSKRKQDNPSSTHYTTWLFNVVLVKKVNGKWRMCVDYTNLNKACPRDAYPLPNIDQLVDSATGNKVLSFLDIYSRYNQIPMVAADMNKIAFITDDASYFFKVMPFGLKNADATYKRLMDKVFNHLMGKCVELYVDDMVVKSTSHLQHAQDLFVVFSILRQYNLKLNREKCVFNVDSGKFPGFMLIQRQIEANPEKCNARNAQPYQHQRSIMPGRPPNFHIQISPKTGRTNLTHYPTPQKIHKVLLER